MVGYAKEGLRQSVMIMLNSVFRLVYRVGESGILVTIHKPCYLSGSCGGKKGVPCFGSTLTMPTLARMSIALLRFMVN